MVDGFYQYTTDYACGGVRIKGGRIIETAPIFFKMIFWTRERIFKYRKKFKKLPCKVLVCGGRDFDDCVFVFRNMDKINKIYNISCVVDGKARGADRIGNKWARFRKKEFKRYPAKWKEFDKKAGPIRNAVMLEDNPDIELVIAFPGGSGTNDMVTQARANEIAVYDLRYEYKP